MWVPFKKQLYQIVSDCWGFGEQVDLIRVNASQAWLGTFGSDILRLFRLAANNNFDNIRSRPLFIFILLLPRTTLCRAKLGSDNV